MKSRDAYKTIGEVCDIVGLVDSETGKRKTHVLRFWEKHFNEIRPKLVHKGRRYYSNQNIEYVKKIKKLLDLHLQIFLVYYFVNYGCRS